MCVLPRQVGRSSEVRGIGKCSTDASMEAPITPSVNVDYTQLLINGQFGDSASTLE
ncbi:hypothetical protein EV1_020916 [Malus domestica]